MSPRGDSEANKASEPSSLDWSWIESLNPKHLAEDDLQKLVPIITDWIPGKFFVNMRFDGFFFRKKIIHFRS